MANKWKPKPPAGGMNKHERRQEKMTDYAAIYEQMKRQVIQADLANRSGRPSSINPFASSIFDEAAPSAPANPLTELAEPIKRWLHKADQSVTWDAVIGNQYAKDELRDAIEAVTKDAELYRLYEMTPPKGIMLYGPPGCGKTMFAKAAVTALGAAEYILINGDEMQSKWAGETEERIRAVFAYARAYRKEKGKPLLVFIDEADAMLPPRGEHRASWRNGQVAQVLTELDGLKEYGAFLILASNRPDGIDSAILRDGRIDRKIKIARPTHAMVMEILLMQDTSAEWLPNGFDHCLVADRLFDNDYLIQELTNPETKKVHRFLLGHIISGAMVVGLMARAKALAFRRDRAERQFRGVTTEDLLAAIDLIYAENKGLNHDFALREFVIDVALPAEALKNLN
jgi:SpoVK/Ycf46/Vps4 family AAA+-type ATPase